MRCATKKCAREYARPSGTAWADIDSDDEWECANGESLSGSDDEPEDADPKEDEFRYDGWLCGDNQIDWIQEGDAEEDEFSSREDDDDMVMDEEDQQDEADGWTA